MLTGACQKPKIKFEPSTIDFGAQLFTSKLEGDPKITKQLKIINDEDKEITIAS